MCHLVKTDIGTVELPRGEANVLAHISPHDAHEEITF